MGAEALLQISTLICLNRSKATCNSQSKTCSHKHKQEGTYFLLARAKNNKRISILINSKFTDHLIRTIVTLLYHQVSEVKWWEASSTCNIRCLWWRMDRWWTLKTTCNSKWWILHTKWEEWWTFSSSRCILTFNSTSSKLWDPNMPISRLWLVNRRPRECTTTLTSRTCSSRECYRSRTTLCHQETLWSQAQSPLQYRWRHNPSRAPKCNRLWPPPKKLSKFQTGSISNKNLDKVPLVSYTRLLIIILKKTWPSK